MFALICPNCGGPLPSRAREVARFSCDYCAVSLTPTAQQFEVLTGTTGSEPAPEKVRLRHSFFESVKDRVGSDGEPSAVLEAVLTEHFGQDIGASVVVHVTRGLLADFRDQTGLELSQDTMALVRVAEAYLQAQKGLHEEGRAHLAVPFLGATAQGPSHLDRDITISEIRALASREVEQPTSAGRKKRWWPF